MNGTSQILNPEREESVPQKQTATQTNITYNPAGNNIFRERYPQMKFIKEPEYQIHANFKPEVTEIVTKLAESIKEAVWDCQRNKTYTQEAYERNIERYLLNNPKVTVISHGIIQKIDQYGNPWEEWMDGNSIFNMGGTLQQPFLNMPPKQGTSYVEFVPLEKDNKVEVTDKALKIIGTILGAVVLVTAIVVTAGAAGALAGAIAGTTLTSMGASAGVTVAAMNVATFATTAGGYTIATAIGVDALNTSVEIGTGTNYIAKGAYELFGNENRTEEYFLNWYSEARDMLYIAGYTYVTFGQYALATGFAPLKGNSGNEPIDMSEYTELSNPEVESILKGRGLNEGTVTDLIKSFDGPIYKRIGHEGDILTITESRLGEASGVFATRGSAGATPTERINNLALPPNNSALVESQIELTRTQILLEGKVAAQPEWSLIANDGIARKGGAWQVVTDGGKYGGAIRRP